MADPDSRDLREQLATAWQAAQAELSRLRMQVARAADLAKASTTAKEFSNEKAEALRRLGEGVWRLVKSGSLELPSSLAGGVAQVKVAEEKAEAHRHAITALLSLDDEVSEISLIQPKTKPKPTVARKEKKR